MNEFNITISIKLQTLRQHVEGKSVSYEAA